MSYFEIALIYYIGWKNIKNFQTTSHNKINLWPIFSHYSLNFSDSFNVSIWEFYFHVMHVTTICGIHLNISHSLCFIFCLSRSKNRMKCEKKVKRERRKEFSKKCHELSDTVWMNVSFVDINVVQLFSLNVWLLNIYHSYAFTHE